VTIALRTQQILAEESGAAETVDPLAGSYYLEKLTDTLEAQAWKFIETIDQLGGIIPPSSAATRSARSPRPPTATSSRSSAARKPSSA